MKNEVINSPLKQFNAKSIVVNLENFMSKVTSKECNEKTVNAACNCAARITDILKLHIEAQRLALRVDNKK